MSRIVNKSVAALAIANDGWEFTDSDSDSEVEITPRATTPAGIKVAKTSRGSTPMMKKGTSKARLAGTSPALNAKYRRVEVAHEKVEYSVPSTCGLDRLVLSDVVRGGR